MRSIVFLGAAFLTVGCVTTSPQAPAPRALTYDEASAFEREIKSQETGAVLQPDFSSLRYIQPVNKKESCKLPTTKDQLERRNFRAYWDGDCKNGYAFGLGRDIAISDTHHVEEITIHNGTGDNRNSPSVGYDFVNAEVVYRIPNGKSPAANYLMEKINFNGSKFFIEFQTISVDDHGNESRMTSSPLTPERLFFYRDGDVIYKFTDNEGYPAVSPSQIKFSIEVVNRKTGLSGVAVVVYANGLVQHLKMTNLGPVKVALPDDYVNYLWGKIKIAQDALKVISANFEKARKMEREYLYLACGDRYVIDGLETGVAKKICDWRKQFNAPYEKALSDYKNEMENLQAKAEAAAQERERAVLQQQLLQKQKTEMELQRFFNTLGEIGREIQHSSQQMMLNGAAMNQPSPQVNLTPFTIPGSNSIRCTTIGVTTTCR